jgi:hypothetical protein
MIAIGLVAMYSLLNAGNPNSLLRLISPNSAFDVYIAMGSSIIVFILGFFVFYSRDVEGFTQIIQLNGDKIRQLRKKGKSDEEIANSILKAMGSGEGYRHNMARKKLVAHLAHFTG